MKKANSNNFTPLLLLLIILAFIGVFLWQNFTPSIGMVFLGVRSQPLPLGLWLISGFFGGWVTAGLIYMIISLSALGRSKKVNRQPTVNYPESVHTPDNLSDQGRSPSNYNDQNHDQYNNSYKNNSYKNNSYENPSGKFATGAKTKIQNEQDFVNNTSSEKVVTPQVTPPIDLNKSSQTNNTVIQEEPVVQPKANFSTVFPSVAPTVVSNLDDDQLNKNNINHNINDDWLVKPPPIGDWERKPTVQNNPTNTNPTNTNSRQSTVEETTRQTEFEADQSPKSESWSGSVYSYGYRDPENTGVGKTESIYDAEFRVIVPPPVETTVSDSSTLVAEVDTAVSPSSEISEVNEVPETSETNEKLPDPPNFRDEQS